MVIDKIETNDILIIYQQQYRIALGSTCVFCVWNSCLGKKGNKICYNLGRVLGRLDYCNEIFRVDVLLFLVKKNCKLIQNPLASNSTKMFWKQINEELRPITLCNKDFGAWDISTDSISLGVTDT